MFLAMSNFLAWAIRRVLLPLLQVYFCLSVSSAVQDLVHPRRSATRLRLWLRKRRPPPSPSTPDPPPSRDVLPGSVC